MPHLEEGLLHELLDGEIPSTDLPPIQAHLVVCPECRARLEEAREFAADADRMIETIELTEQDTPSRAELPPRARPTRWRRDVAWAATVVVAVGAGYLARGSGQAILSPDVASVAQPAEPAETLLNAATDAVAERDGPSRKAASPSAVTGKAAQSEAGESKLGAAAPEKPKDLLDSAKRTRAFETPLRLEEIVTTSTAESPRLAAGKAAPAPPATQSLAPRANDNLLDQSGNLSRGVRREAVPVEITFSDARLRLGGALRQIEGMVPVRLEVLEPDVRVVYPIAGGELILAQRLVDGRITYTLVAPSTFPVDSLERLRARVRN